MWCKCYYIKGANFCESCGTKVDTIISFDSSCPQCGMKNKLDVSFCANCGSGFTKKITFSEAILICFKKGGRFRGRSTRAEYWYFYLFILTVGFSLGLISEIASIPWLMDYATYANFIFVIPQITVTTRRLHDTNHSGWWQLLYFTLIGIPYLIYLLAKKGTTEKNKYG